MPVFEDRVSKILNRHRELKSRREPWMTTYQLIGKYVMTRKQNFTTEISPGQFLTGRIFDNTAPNANHLLASSLIGALWPNGSKTFQIEPPTGMRKELAESDEVKKYYQEVTSRMINVMDNPKSGLLTSLEEYMLDQGAFGTSGISVLEEEADYETPIRYKAVDAKVASIDEGCNGFVDTVYIERELTVRQLVQEYGPDQISKESAASLKEGKVDKKVKVLHAIEPRIDGMPGAFGNDNFPIASIHIEIESKHILAESGFHEMPIFVVRFWKAMNEIYGRSPAMECMSDIKEINALRQAAIVATETYLRPPLLVNDDGTVGGGVIDTSPGAINVRRISGRMGDAQHKAVEQLFTVGELNSTYKRITELTEVISNNFFIDRLLDLNNEQRMTLGEANIRNNLRGQSLGTIYSRQIAELFTPLIERTFNILLGRGTLGVTPNSQQILELTMKGEIPLIIPDAVLDLMMEGKDAFKVSYISPAARIMKTEELMGIQQTLLAVENLAPNRPDVLDVLDIDSIIRNIQTLTGAPANILKAADVVADERAARAEQQAQQAQMIMAQQQAETAKTGAQAAKEASKAGIPAAQLGAVA